MPTRHNTSFCRFHFSPRNWTCTSARPRHSTMVIRRTRSSAASNAPATRKKRNEQLEPTKIYTYWHNNPAFDPKRLLLRRLFLLMRTGPNTSVGFYPARKYLQLVEFWVVRRRGGTKTQSSAMNRWTLWRKAFACYGTPCVVAKRLLGVAGARAVHFGRT